ncbi:MAG: menaquinone biosynthetic enzyme MqnA/MqnD family protein [Bacteroidota bacterium]
MKIRISAVSYLNSLPFVYGLEHTPIKDRIILEKDIPSQCASKLIDNKVDIGLVPVAILPQLPYYQLIGNYCIGAYRSVRTVVLVGNVPVEQMRWIVQDTHSRTSVALAKVLAQHHWRIEPSWKHGSKAFEHHLNGNQEGGVVIGDKVFPIENKYPYQYDLAEEWFQMTGMPFVFAAWVANKPIAPEFEQALNQALEWGIQHIPQMLEASPELSDIPVDLSEYLTHSIQFNLDKDKRKALDAFLDYLKPLNQQT